MTTAKRQKQLDEVLWLVRSLEGLGAPVTIAVLAAELAKSYATVRRLVAVLVNSGSIIKLVSTGRTAQFRMSADEAAPLLGATGGSSPRPTTSPRDPVVPPASDLGGLPRATLQAEVLFDPQHLDRTVISLPLEQFLRDWTLAETSGNVEMLKRVGDRTRIQSGRFSVIIDLNTGYIGGIARARERVFDLLLMVEISSGKKIDQGSLLDVSAPPPLRAISDLYVVARLMANQVRMLVELDQARPGGGAANSSARRAIFRIWPDNVIKRQGYTALPTIKADAARNSFGCTGRDIVWAVVDSGIDSSHLHFAAHRNLEDLPAGVAHTDLISPDNPQPLIDTFGHGTHVAGIIAGELVPSDSVQAVAVSYERDMNAKRQPLEQRVDGITGVAPQCKLVSYKVLDDKGEGGVSEIMAALEGILRVNGYGKSMRIHGVNMSLGYTYDPQWFACGHSPLCEVVDRLSRSGVCVVVAAGNSGFGYADTLLAGTWAQGMSMSINDPGNAEQAITVGSTHRDAPHTYGVSYFSSKGPTGDGRWKPDLLAPGEKIISCRSAQMAPAEPDAVLGEPKAASTYAYYRQDSGTSMAAPHVSGAIAALLSVRREFIGRSSEVKRVLLDSALDLKRDRNMQGHGLIDLFSALQAI